MDAQSIRELDDKFGFARLLQRLGLPGPGFWLVGSPSDVESHPLGENIVIKPLQGEGSRGVRRVQTRKELRAVVAAQRDFPARPLLLHEYIPGEDIDLSLLADHGEIVAWTIHRRSSRSLGYRLGSVSFLENENVLRLGRELVRTIQYHGVAHIDMRCDSRDGSIKLIEFNPRLYGSIHFAAFAGVNFVTLGLKLADGTRPPSGVRQTNGAANTPLALLRLLFHNPERIKRFTPATRRALRQAILDPLPWMASRLRRRKAQMPVSL
jgi:predicted ATP-grasp superfamily ATP-dependent carboligase